MAKENDIITSMRGIIPSLHTPFSKDNKIEEKVIYKDYLKTTESVTKKKYNTQIEVFDFYTLRRIPHDTYQFYYDTNGYLYIKEEKKNENDCVL